MKKILILVAGLLIGFSVFIKCKKDSDDPQPAPTPFNRSPSANAGTDITLTLTSCGSTVTIKLDGTASSDPEGSALIYSWAIMPGPNSNRIDIRNPKSSQPTISVPLAGQFYIELTVTDLGGLYAKDIVMIKVIGATPTEYNLDITFNGMFQFDDNYEDCYYC